MKSTIVSNGHGYAALCQFFNGVRQYPFAIQDFMATLAAGNLLCAELLPVYLLPHALLLHAMAPEPGVVDDAVLLTERILEEYDSAHTGHGPRFWHPQGHLVSGLVYGVTDPDSLVEIADAQYIHEVHEVLTNDDTWKKMFAGLPLPKARKQTQPPKQTEEQAATGS